MTEDHIQRALDLAYEAAQESARYWYTNDAKAKTWVESDSYAALRRHLERFKTRPSKATRTKETP